MLRDAWIRIPGRVYWLQWGKVLFEYWYIYFWNPSIMSDFEHLFLNRSIFMLEFFDYLTIDVYISYSNFTEMIALFLLKFYSLSSLFLRRSEMKWSALRTYKILHEVLTFRFKFRKTFRQVFLRVYLINQFHFKLHGNQTPQSLSNWRTKNVINKFMWNPIYLWISK